MRCLKIVRYLRLPSSRLLSQTIGHSVVTYWTSVGSVTGELTSEPLATDALEKRIDAFANSPRRQPIGVNYDTTRCHQSHQKSLSRQHFLVRGQEGHTL